MKIQVMFYIHAIVCSYTSIHAYTIHALNFAFKVSYMYLTTKKEIVSSM